MDEFKFQGKSVADWKQKELISFFEQKYTDYFYDDYDVPFARYDMDNYNINEVEVTLHDDTTATISILGYTGDVITIYTSGEYEYVVTTDSSSGNGQEQMGMTLWESNIDISSVEAFLMYFQILYETEGERIISIIVDE